MANEEQLAILEQGVDVWNKWRDENPGAEIDLMHANLIKTNLGGINLGRANLNETLLIGADLSRANLREACFVRAFLTGANLNMVDLTGAHLGGASLNNTNLTDADLRRSSLRDAYLSQACLNRANIMKVDLIGANLMMAQLKEARLQGAKLNSAYLSEANFSRANLSKADLSNANLSKANFSRADLREAALKEANLTETDLSEANLSRANLNSACLVRTNLSRANLTESRIYGISAWDVNLRDTMQMDLAIAPKGQPKITVDSLEVAQFIYLLLNNENLRDVIDTITSKAVLILGNFNYRRRPVLNAIREQMRNRGFLPIIFDFPTPENRDMTETVRILAQMSKFIIADISEPRCIPHELASVVPDLAVPVQIIVQMSMDERPYAMVTDLWKYHWVMEPLMYTNHEALVGNLERIVDDALAKVVEIKEKRLSNTPSEWKVI